MRQAIKPPRQKIRLRIRKPDWELIPWVILAICLIAAIGAAFVVLSLDSQRLQHDSAEHHFKCAHCSNTRYHVHQGIDKRHYEDY